MELLHEAPPPGYEGVAKAFEMARHLPTTHRMNVQIGLVHGGQLFARGRLDGYRQVTFLREHLRSLGWREHLLGGDDDLQGCDMMFSHPADHPHTQDADPSFIRRPVMDLWPAAADHAND
jgi:hypothetical protein